ncbi:MAG: hypothetical protein KF870_04345 [Leadbetterella sp.]|nr:hypothetical protein [Leadbetterella sp.]
MIETEEILKPLSDFFGAIEKDPRISITHIGIYAALLQYRKQKGLINPIIAFSHQIMRIAKISSPTTYHKCVRDLSDFGYIEYEPSFRRNLGSKIYFPENQGIGMSQLSKNQIAQY